MSQVCWGCAMPVALLALALGAAPLPVVGHDESADVNVSPVDASADFNSILSAVLNQVSFGGRPEPPPPPPKPGQKFHRPEEKEKPLMFDDHTAAVCEKEKRSELNCSHLVEADVLQYGPTPEIPVQLLRELIAANRSSVRIECPSSKKVKCGDSESVLVAHSREGTWRDFYAKFPETAGFMRVSSAVLTHDRAKALIYIEFGCDNMCDSGGLVLLKRDGSSWIVEYQERLWES